MNYDISEIMTKNPTWISADANINDAIDILKVTKLSHLLIKERTKLIGVISKEDLIEKFYDITAVSSGTMYNTMVLNNTKVKSLIKKPPITIHLKSPLIEAIELMIKNEIHSVPVFNDENDIVGIITPMDILYATYKSAS